MIVHHVSIKGRLQFLLGTSVQRKCKVTGRDFEVNARDRARYEEHQLALPSLSPSERIRHLLSFQNDHQKFSRRCDVTGEQTWSLFLPKVHFPVYSNEYWWSEKWDPMMFGRDFDFKRLFVEQFLELWLSVPRPASPPHYVLSDSANNTLPGCVDVFDSHGSSNCFYSVGLWDCVRCVDCLNLYSSDDCFQCINCFESSGLRWSENCLRCEDSWFLSSSKDCKNCLFCSNLSGKQFHILNQSVSEEEYRKVLQDWKFFSYQSQEEAREKFRRFLAEQGYSNLESSLWEGEGVTISAACYQCRDVSSSQGLFQAEECLDGVGFGGGLRSSVGFVSVGNNAEHIFNSIECWNNVSNLHYCTYCEESSHLFGCIGLRGRKYCIFNKQYTKADYFNLLKEIKAHLQKRKIWGKFLSPSFSCYAYNQSSADIQMPLSRVPAKMMGYRWESSLDELPPASLLERSNAADAGYAEFADSYCELDSSVVANNEFLCELSGNPFRYNPKAVELCSAFGVAPSRRSFEKRHLERKKRQEALL